MKEERDRAGRIWKAEIREREKDRKRERKVKVMENKRATSKVLSVMSVLTALS